jgi:hypothetical protein
VKCRGLRRAGCVTRMVQKRNNAENLSLRSPRRKWEDSTETYTANLGGGWDDLRGFSSVEPSSSITTELARPNLVFSPPPPPSLYTIFSLQAYSRNAIIIQLSNLCEGVGPAWGCIAVSSKDIILTSYVTQRRIIMG